MSRKSRTFNVMRDSQNRFIDSLNKKEDDYDDENTSMLVTKKWKDLPKKVKEAAEIQRGRAVIYAPDDNDNIGWVPEKGTTNDNGYYKKWFRNRSLQNYSKKVDRKVGE